MAGWAKHKLISLPQGRFYAAYFNIGASVITQYQCRRDNNLLAIQIMKTSDKILLGIYQHFPRLNEDISFDSGELAWVIHNGIDGWRIESGWKKIDYPATKAQGENSYLDQPLRDRALVAKELTILQASGCLEFSRPSGFDMRFKVQLQPVGLLRAERLSSIRGRIELWYSEHKDGIFGLVVTIAVAALTAWLTAKFTR